MNNKIKAAAAAAVAGVLLMGGYGTLAEWKDAVVLSEGTVRSGELKLSDATPGVWTDVSNPELPIDIATFKIVPGDELTYKTSATISASGDNLTATLVADPSTVTADAALASEMEVTTSVTHEGSPISNITSADNGKTVDVEVRFEFDESEATNDSQLGSLNLQNLKLALTQS